MCQVAHLPAGKPLPAWVYQQCRQCQQIRELLGKRPHALLRPWRASVKTGGASRPGVGTEDGNAKPRPWRRSEPSPTGWQAHLPGGQFSGVRARGKAAYPRSKRAGSASLFLRTSLPLRVGRKASHDYYQEAAQEAHPHQSRTAHARRQPRPHGLLGRARRPGPAGAAHQRQFRRWRGFLFLPASANGCSWIGKELE